MSSINRLLILLTSLLAVTLPIRAADFLLGPHQNVVIFGDSITANGEYGQIMQELIDQRYPERQVNILPRGAAGDTVQRAMGRIEEDVVCWRPALVLINLGINDAGRFSPEEYLTHYETMINRIVRDTGARIGIVSPEYPDKDEEVMPVLREYVTGLQALAKKYDALYIPLYETTRRLRPSLPKGVVYAPDGIHPNRLGYWIFAQTILAALNYPFAKTPLTVEIPARRLSAEMSDALAGTTFTVALPMPLQVTLTNTPLRTVTIARAKKPVTIDGNLDDWDLGAPMRLGEPAQLVSGVMSWPRDKFRARAYACYDDTAWYFAIQVNDSMIINPPKPRHVVSRDCLEVCLDLRPAEERVARPAEYFWGSKPHIAQFILAPAVGEVLATAEMGNGDRSLLTGVKVASTQTPFGYQVEFSVPAASFPGALKPGLRIGFDCAAINVDRHDNYAEAQELRWTGSPWSAGSTREFGTMVLGE